MDGGSTFGDFDVGKKTLIPYILKRGYTSVDYVIISHCDQDHIGGILSIIKELKVKNVIIGKQFENSENYQELKRILKEKKSKLKIVEAGEKISLEKDVEFHVLWPSSNNIKENSLNNNAMVCKFIYKNFSMLFTGDIEEIAEKAILEKYKKTPNILKADVLKVAHHGSKTSSTNEFLEIVRPKIALIGVGKNNLFNHPSNVTLSNLKHVGCKIYRTDEMGEIVITVNSKGIKIREKL